MEFHKKILNETPYNKTRSKSANKLDFVQYN